jgi:hypothetical protein
MLEQPEHPSDTLSGENSAVGSISRKELSSVWLAAAIDGEGCIAANWWKQTNPDVRYKGKPNLRLTVKIYNTHPLFIRRITECLVVLGIRFTVTGQSARKSGERPGVTVCVDARPQIQKLLPIIVPYLTVKKRQAELILELLAYRDTLSGQERGCKGTFSRLALHEDDNVKRLVAEIKREKHDFPSVFSFSRRPNEVFGLSSET